MTDPNTLAARNSSEIKRNLRAVTGNNVLISANINHIGLNLEAIRAHPWRWWRNTQLRRENRRLLRLNQRMLDRNAAMQAANWAMVLLNFQLLRMADV